ncbi:co-chaperone YbbN [Shewanella glacialimarina]|jgi:putative thioredoxin|uniref:co-chaperone YbbN n=1 Tax=Shewanella glacialimarina TaxID=2590884 RepID=UPI001CF84581|nr:tetratricopeptide repeat protein [Shewanella glacialimarina]UCX04188.1 tetratricopeptide repeat protein [Shewanella glacialimarina]
MEHIISLTKENIQQVVDASMEKVVVLTFFAQQKPESIQMLQTLEQLATVQAGRFILASVDCEVEMEIAQYFQIESLPTTLILDKGRPIDGFAGVQDAASVASLLDKHLPALWLQAFDGVKAQLAQAEPLTQEALTLLVAQLKEIAVQADNMAEVRLVLADVYLQLGALADAKPLIEGIGLADQDSYYQNLKAKLALAEDAADTPEIRQLQQQLEETPGDIILSIDLAKALNKAQRNEEALACLFSFLQKDLNAGDGKVKQMFLEIMTAMGQGNALANQYRRKLYTLLY